MGKDPAFLFYDGDAARDVSHMNRLERGCYFDFIQAQKKFGPLSLNVIKKVLGQDFETCWESLKICLTYDDDMYYITWLKDSIEKRQKYSESRSKNKKGTKVLKTNKIKTSYVHHMENAIEIVNEDVIKNKGDLFKKLFDDEQYTEELGMVHKGKSLNQAFNECYIHHSNAPNPPQTLQEWKQKLNTWLSNTKINGTRNGTKTDIRRSDATIENSDFGKL